MKNFIIPYSNGDSKPSSEASILEKKRLDFSK
jgi:hypothetical protein